jgi:diguanylate cyclase (GGDEF)-like protein
MAAGADDFLPRGVSPDEIALSTSCRAERARRLRERMDADLLTGLLRRRGFLEALMRSHAECARHGRPMAVALCDVDHFKEINDRYGHASGDLVLSALGRLLAGSFRAQDLRGRWGGEEFILAFPGETAESVWRAVESVLERLAGIPFAGADGPPFHVTCSAGVAAAPRDGTSMDQLLRAADRRLYVAKRSGRARVVAAD